jgi:hypothetical protein
VAALGLRHQRQHGGGPAPASAGNLFITAFIQDHGPLARTYDHAKAVLTYRDTPATSLKSPKTPVAARQVKE